MSDKPIYFGTTSSFDDPYVKQQSRLVNIYDPDGDLKFKVQQLDLSATNQFAYPDHQYQVFVSSFTDVSASIVVSAIFDLQPEAADYFDLLVDTYKGVAIASKRSEQSIDIYSQKIDYYRISPDCCKTCKFAMPIQHEYIFESIEPLELSAKTTYRCTNPKTYDNGCQTLSAKWKVVYADVHDDGICKNFERVVVEDVPSPTFIRNDIGIDPSLKSKIDREVQAEFRRLQRQYEGDIEVVHGGSAEQEMA